MFKIYKYNIICRWQHDNIQQIPKFQWPPASSPAFNCTVSAVTVNRPVAVVAVAKAGTVSWSSSPGVPFFLGKDVIPTTITTDPFQDSNL